MDNTSSVYLYEMLNWDTYRFLPTESKDCMNSASFCVQKYDPGEGDSIIVPMGMPTICFENLPRKDHKNVVH